MRAAAALLCAALAGIAACRAPEPRLAADAAPACPPPGSGWAAAGSDPLDADRRPIAPVANVVALRADGSVSWNGDSVEGATLARFLGIVGTMNPRPRLVLDPRPGADCAAASALAAEIERRLGCAPRFCRWGAPQSTRR